MKIRGENCKRGCTRDLPSLLDQPKQQPVFKPTLSKEKAWAGKQATKAMEWGEVDGWHTCVVTPVNEGVYAKQYENKDAEVQTTYT